MSAYLIVDVEDLLASLQSRAYATDYYQLAVRLRSTAALAAGLFSMDALKAIAVADWGKISSAGSTLQTVFESTGFEAFHMPERRHIADAILMQYFAFDPDPVDELIIVTSSADVTTLIQRVKMQRNARVRIWAEQPPQIDGIIFQPLDAILGIQTKSVALYIDFENIAISLTQNGFMVNIDRLIEGLVSRAGGYGQTKRMAAYAPWGQRGSLPALVDDMGREVSDEAPSRLMMSNIDPVYNLPGKNSADMRIAKDVLAEANQPSSPDTFIIASGDRDFNEVFLALRAKNKNVVVWGVRGSTSKMLETNPAFTVEYLDDFLALTRQEVVGQMYSSAVSSTVGAAAPFTPSQFSSLVLQYDRLAESLPSGDGVSVEALQDQLKRTTTVVSSARGKDLLNQAIAMGIFRSSRSGGVEVVSPIAEHSIVERTRLVRDRVVQRVANTLDVRGWEYVNYGFLLKGITMDRELEKPGLNIDDTWRSLWVDTLVREGILQREMVPHRHNPEDLVPVIKVQAKAGNGATMSAAEVALSDAYYDEMDFTTGVHAERDAETDRMMKRIIVSVDQFTSYRGFTWCPLGSLHRRLRGFDSGVVFQRAVEWLVELGAATIDAYENPQSAFKTKGIALIPDAPMVVEMLAERNRFILALLSLYEQRLPLNFMTIGAETSMDDSTLELWISLMQAENVLNPVTGKPGLYSLFRTHHTVNQVADSRGTPPINP